MSTDDLCTYEVDGNVAVLAFNRPDNMNGMIGDMEVSYLQNLLRAEADREVRAIVVTGNGRAFCAGADLAFRAGDGQEPLPNASVPTTTPLDISKPMIAAVNGACAGVGMAYALQCDIRFAAKGAKFTTAFARRGLIAEYGLAWLLSHIAGRAVAMDLLLSGRVFVAEDAADMGLVHRVVEGEKLLDEAIAYATDLAKNVSPASMATIKREVNDQVFMTPHEAVAASDMLMRESATGPDVKEGVQSFLERRQTEFAPLGEGTRFTWMDD